MVDRPDTHLWHPFSDMSTVRHDEVVIERGEGVWLWDSTGRRLLDGTAALWYVNVGHGRTEIADAVREQMSSLATYSVFGDLGNRPALELAERLAGLAPVDGGRVFLGNGGGDGTEAAAKLVRLYWQALGQSERLHIVSRTYGYHGSQAFATSIGGIDANRTGYGPLVTSTSHVPHDSAAALRAEIERLGAEHVAAFFVEPVIGAGGVYPPVEGYVEEVAEICRETGVLLVLDATICGFGRVGTWFAAERWGVRPDLIIFAKGVTSGYLPLGGVVVSDRVAEPFWDRGGTPFRHGQTYSGHPSCCAAALANMDIMEREGLVERGRTLEGDLYQALLPFASHPLVHEVRGGCGLLAAVELDAGLLERAPGTPTQLYKAIRDEGQVLVRPLVRGVAVSPPLTITPAEIGELADGISAGLDALLERVAPELDAARA